MSYSQDYPVEGAKPQAAVVVEEKPKAEEVVVQAEKPVESIHTPVEVTAMEQGWVPKEQWSGDPDKWRPAEVFVENGKHFEVIQKQNKQIKKLNKQLTESARLTKKLVDKTREDTVKDLEVKKNQLLTQFVKDNDWYAKDESMRKYADLVAAGYAQTNPGEEVEDILEYVVGEVKARFPSTFKNSKASDEDGDEGNEDEPKSFVSKVGSSKRTSANSQGSKSKSKKASARDLNARQREIGQRWVEMKVLPSLDVYAQQLQEMGEI